MSDPSLVSLPSSDKDDWTSFWHPLFGTCFTFKPVKPVSESIGSSEIEQVSITVVFSAAFPEK
jgi:hypothetical protein